jgi:hypothetical protein
MDFGGVPRISGTMRTADAVGRGIGVIASVERGTGQTNGETALHSAGRGLV